MKKIKELGKVGFRGGIFSCSLYKCTGCNKTFKKINAEMEKHKEESVCKDCYQKMRRKKALGTFDKLCKKCGNMRHFDEFYFKNKEKTYRSSICKQCTIEKNHVYALTVSPEVRKIYRKRSHVKGYGLSLEEYNSYFENTNCGICGTKGDDKNRLVLDHCHLEGHIRGVLCDNCNKALGLFKDNIDYLQNSITWLKKD